MLVEDLSRKIEEQRRELESRNQNLMAIQRNFDGLNSILKKEKDLGGENKKRVLSLTEENNKLSEENRLLLRRYTNCLIAISLMKKELKT